MTKKIVWFALSCLMMAALVLASCAPAGTEEEKKEEADKPQYGGTITSSKDAFEQIDPYRYENRSMETTSLCFEYMIMEDWATPWEDFSFPGGTGAPLPYCTGALAESWEMPEANTLILHIRQGVKFHDKPPVNGREFTIDDALWNIARFRDNPFIDRTYIDKMESVRALDEWTLEIKLSERASPTVVRELLQSNSTQFIAPETVGDSGEIEDWEKMIGTGPYMVSEYVADSVVVFARHPDYWGYDERYPENQLPYADYHRMVVIPEYSTWLSALRTGKIDHKGTGTDDIAWNDGEALIKTNPELQFRKRDKASTIVFAPRNDKEPFTDVRVRQAMSMSVDRQAIVDSFFGGNADFYGWAMKPLLGELYIPYDELPDEPMWTDYSCKDILSYNPEEAKKLLAEAGFPDGFQTNIVATPARGPGLPEILQASLADIGIEAEIKSYEWATFNTIRYGKTHDQIVTHWNSTYMEPLKLFDQWANPDHKFNLQCSNDPVFNEMFKEARAVTDASKLKAHTDKLSFYSLEHVFRIPIPPPKTYVIWQPWLKGYRGEGIRTGNLMARLWVDQEVKDAIMGK